MKKKYTTLSARLLLSYFVFVGLIIGVIVFSWTLFENYKQIKAYQDNINQLLVSQLKIYKLEKNFINDEVKDSNFYISNKSYNFEEMQKETSIFFEIITEMKKTTISKNRNLDVNYSELQLYLQAYINNFSKIVDLYKQRGFKDYGIEGELRSIIHDLEKNYDSFNKIDLLTLRRVEKDFIIRKDTQYIVSMSKKQNQILEKNYVKSNPELSIKLKSYFDLFFQLASIENKIGIDHNNGLKGKTEYYFLKTTEKLTFLQNATKELEQIEYKKIVFDFIYVVILAIIIAFLLSYIITKSIHNPIVEIVRMMNEKQDYHYTNIPEFTNNTSIEEIKTIQNGFLNMYISICKNISELEIQNKNLQNLNHLLADTNEELKQREIKLNKSNKLKAVFISIISHDIKGPLNSLKGFLDIIVDYPNAISETDKILHFKKIRENTHLQINLLTNLLVWTNSQDQEFKINKTSFDVLEILDCCLDLLNENLIKKNITIVNHITNFELMTDKNMIELVFRNLISNAIKFSKNNSKITLNVEKKEQNVVFSVMDNGVGISKESLETLNQFNQQISSRGTENEIGTGFGLLFCHSFVAKLGGELKIYSTKGSGTTVYFSIPSDDTFSHSIITETENFNSSVLNYA